MRVRLLLIGTLLGASPGSAFGQYIPAATGWSTTAGSANGQTQTATTNSPSYVTLDTLDFTVSPDSTGFFTAEAAVVLGNLGPFAAFPRVRYLLDGAPLGNAFFESIDNGRFKSMPTQVTLSGLSPGNHQLSLQWNAGDNGVTVNAFSRSLRLTGYNSVGGQPTAVGWAAGAGSPDGNTITATTPGATFTNLQTINFTAGAASNGLFNVSSTVVIGGGGAPPGFIRLRYLLDGAPYGNAFHLLYPTGYFGPVSLPAQISGLSAGDHQLSLQWARLNTNGDYTAYTQSMQLTGFNIVNGVSAAQGWSATAGSADGQAVSATTNSTSYVDLQTINFTADALTTGLFDVAGSLVLGNVGTAQTVGLRYLLDGVQFGPGFTTTLSGGTFPQSFSFPLQFGDVLPGDHVFKVQWADFSGGGVNAFSQVFTLTGYNFIPVPEASSLVGIGLVLGAWVVRRKGPSVAGPNYAP